MTTLRLLMTYSFPRTHSYVKHPLLRLHPHLPATPKKGAKWLRKLGSRIRLRHLQRSLIQLEFKYEMEVSWHDPFRFIIIRVIFYYNSISGVCQRNRFDTGRRVVGWMKWNYSNFQFNYQSPIIMYVFNKNAISPNLNPITN